MALQAVQMVSTNIDHVPQDMINQELLAAFMIDADYHGDDLQSYFKKPRTYTAEDVIMQVVPKSFEIFAELPAMYINQNVFNAAEKLYKNHADWPQLCKDHNRDAVESDWDDALETVWGCYVDEAYILKAMKKAENFQGVSNIPHHLMTPAVIDAMLADSCTHIQYLPHHLMTETLALRAVNDWQTNLDSVAEEFRTLTVCQAALKRCKADKNYLLHEVIAAIPKQYLSALNLA
jgi:hypothetical protein